MTVFNEIPEKHKLYVGKYFFIVKDKFPVSTGHCLIVSKEASRDYFELSEIEKSELILLIDKAKELIELEYSPDGYNIGMNCGDAAGQTVMHFHCHVIPRYVGDMKDPRGGIRHCIEGKGYYNT
jgi:diadenosine tetraphosphate (Ap4A) HIT family hydrolase